MFSIDKMGGRSETKHTELVGLSTDTKPTDIENGSIFKEIDTQNSYIFNSENSQWIKMKQNGGGVSNYNDLENKPMYYKARNYTYDTNYKIYFNDTELDEDEEFDLIINGVSYRFLPDGDYDFYHIIDGENLVYLDCISAYTSYGKTDIEFEFSHMGDDNTYVLPIPTDKTYIIKQNGKTYESLKFPIIPLKYATRCFRFESDYGQEEYEIIDAVYLTPTENFNSDLETQTIRVNGKIIELGDRYYDEEDDEITWITEDVDYGYIKLYYYNGYGYSSQEYFELIFGGEYEYDAIDFELLENGEFHHYYAPIEFKEYKAYSGISISDDNDGTLNALIQDGKDITFNIDGEDVTLKRYVTEDNAFYSNRESVDSSLEVEYTFLLELGGYQQVVETEIILCKVIEDYNDNDDEYYYYCAPINEVSLVEYDTTIEKPYKDAIEEMVFQCVDDGKELIADAITDKGVETSASDTFEQMAENIGLISDEFENKKTVYTGAGAIPTMYGYTFNHTATSKGALVTSHYDYCNNGSKWTYTVKNSDGEVKYVKTFPRNCGNGQIAISPLIYMEEGDTVTCVFTEENKSSATYIILSAVYYY